MGAAASVMVAVAALLALVGGGAAQRPATSHASGGWRTVSLSYDLGGGSRRVLVDVPVAWTQTSGGCFLDLAANRSSCDDGEGVSLRPNTSNQDFTFPPGLHAAADYDYPVGDAWSGYVTVGPADGAEEAYVDVASDDQQTALRVLGSVRPPGQQVPDLSGTWPVTAERDVAWSGPRSVSVDSRVLPETTDVYYDGTARKEGATWRAQQVVDGVILGASAPTRALAELVAGSAGPDDASTPARTWTTRTVDGVTLDLPPGWVRLDTGACRAGQTRFGPVGTEPCATSAPLAVSSARSVLLDGTPGLGSGYVLAGDQVVAAEGDPDDVRRVLASAHVSGEDPGDLDGTWEQHSDAGVTWQQPLGAYVRVEASKGSTVSCAIGGPRYPAAPVTGGQWQAAYCGGGTASVVASTQALADVVASTVRG